MAKAPLYKDRREKIWPGISPGMATFLQQKWNPDMQGASLNYQGHYFFLYPWSSGASWAGHVQHLKSGEEEKLTPSGCASILAAKAALYEMMTDMKKRRSIKAQREKKRV